MSKEDIQQLIRRVLQFIAVFFFNISHYLKNLYRENPNARVAIDLLFSVLGGVKEIVYGEKARLPITEKWSEYIDYEFSNNREIDLFDKSPEQLFPSMVTINKINSSTYLVNNDMPLEEVQPSKERFITVQYTHPNMPLALTLEIPPGMYQKCNEILGASFVYWCLKYQYQRSEYIFDENYKLELIDADLNMLSVGATQSILLGEKDGYEVVCRR
jgi:hypothetical protein